MPAFFCTYFDRKYLPRMLAMQQSMVRHCPDSQLFALCMDEESYETLSERQIAGVVALRLADLEQYDPELARARPTRSLVEYYWTCGPAFMLYVLEHFPAVDVLWYLDADVCFYSAPEPMFAELGAGSIGIVEHRFSRRAQRLAKFGTYNVGVMAFRSDAAGLETLRWWRQRCIEWCYDRLEGDRFADQRYLEDWPERFHGVRVLQGKGINLAPWNLANYHVSLRDGQMFVDDDPLIIFHFHGLRQVNSWLYDLNLARSGARASRAFRVHVAAPYLRELRRLSLQEQKNVGSLRQPDAHVGTLLAVVRQTVRLLQRLSPGSYIAVFDERVI